MVLGRECLGLRLGRSPDLLGLGLRRTIHPVHIPRTIDRNEQQRAFLQRGAGLLNRLAGHVIERPRLYLLPLPALVLHDERARPLKQSEPTKHRTLKLTFVKQ